MKSICKIKTVVCSALLLFSANLSAKPLEIAREALADKLYRVAQINAEKALKNTEQAERLQALEILLEALARQNKYEEILNALQINSDLIIAYPDNEALLYWRVLALFNIDKYNDIANIINAGRVGTNTAYGVTTLRIGARVRNLFDDVNGAVELFRKVDEIYITDAIRAANAYEWAVMLDQRGRYQDALDVLKRLAQLDIQNDDVDQGALLRGRILMKLGRADEATRIMDALAMNDRVAEISRVQALVEMSVYKFNAAQTNEAVAYARSAYERARQPQTRKISGYRLGDLLCRSSQTIEEGARIIKALIREFPEDDDSRKAHLKLADSFLQLNMPEEAAAEYRIFLQTYPASTLDSHVMQGRGWALLKLKRYTEAGLAFERAAELTDDPEEKAECLFKRCDAFLADNRYAEAALAYAELNARLPDTSLAGRALYLSAEALERDGRMDLAKERYLETAKRYSQRDVASDALLRVAAIQTVQKDIDAAVATYSLVLNEFTNVLVTAQAYMGRGRAYYNKYQFELAMQDFAAVAETAPTRVDEARYYQILCLYGLGREPDALKAAEKYIIDFPSSSFFPDMLLWIGKFHFNRNDFAAAVKYFNKYVEGFPNRKWADTALLWSARALNNQGDFSAAIETITRFVNNYPDSARLSEARFVQATALIELARFDAAILLLDSVIESASESRWKQMAMLHKGNCLFALGAGNPLRYEEALAVYTAISQSGEQPSAVLIEIFYKIGRCLEKLERFDEAVDCYYSQVLLRYQRDNAAGTWYDEATLSLVMRAAFSAAEIFEKQGQYEQAIGILEKIVKSGSGAADEAQRRIGVINKIKD